MNEIENRQSLDCSEQMADTEPVIVEDVSSSEDEESELLPREEDMEAAADIVIQAEKAASPGATATEPGAVRIRGTSEDAGPVRTTNEDPPSVIAVRDDMTEVYDNFAEELDSVTQSIPLLVASLAREGSTMTVEALEERFKRITEMLVSLEQRQKEFQSASQQKSNSSLTSERQYSEALEQRFRQITDMLTCMQQQQVEAFRRYEEAQSMNQHRPSFDEPSERTTSVASSIENESSQDLSALSMSTCRPGEQMVSSRSPIDPSGSFSYLRNSLQREELRRDLPKPDPPAMQILVEDVLEKLDPDGKIQTNEADSNLPQERLAPVHSVRRVLEGANSESSLDRKPPARNDVQERPASAQSRQTTDSQEGHGDESQRDRKLPSRNTSEDRSTSDRSQKVVDTGGDASPKPPFREPVSTQSFPDESPMRIIQNAASQIHEPNVEIQSIDQDTWETRADARVGAIPVAEIKLNIMAPPGLLGVTFADDTEPPTVSAIEKSSPIFGSLEVGDELLKVNDEDVRWMSSAMISRLLSCREDEYRELGIQRAVRVGAENRPVNRQILRQMIGRQAAVSSESNTETSKSETPANSRERYRAEVETLVRLLVPEEIDNVDVMMDWFSGREADLVSTLRTMQEKNMAQRVQSEEDESTSSNDKAPRRDSPPEKREADTRAASETIGREPPGTTPLQPHSIQRNGQSEPGAIRVGGVYPSEDDPTVEVGGSTASQEPISATVVCASDPDAQLTQLTEAVATIQRQQQELLDANRNRGGRSCRDRFEMFISCLFCLRTRPAYPEES
jgi:archaellum component FlaC